MGESVSAVRAAHPEPDEGDVFATNDPAAGGSHLPDVTVVTPVHDASGRLRFFVASRGHHADIGGLTPGSMPPNSTVVEEEGVLIDNFLLVDRGEFREKELYELLASGDYPTRNPDQNTADIKAQIAANEKGVAELRRMVTSPGGTTAAALQLFEIGHFRELVHQAVEAAYHRARELGK